MRKTTALRTFQKNIVDKMKAEGPRYAEEVEIQSIGSRLLESFHKVRRNVNGSSVDTNDLAVKNVNWRP